MHRFFISLAFALTLLSADTSALAQSDSSIVIADTMASITGLKVSIVADARDYPNRVTLIVVVRDSEGRLVAGLAPPYEAKERFAGFWRGIVENDAKGKEHSVREMNVREHRANAAEPAAVSLVLDYSGSMLADISSMEEGVRRAFTAVDSGSPLAVVKFDHRVRVVHPMGPTAAVPNVGLQGLEDLGGGTALYDAASTGLDQLSQSRSPRKALVLFTDGSDNSSLFTTPSGIAKRAKREGVEIHTIAYSSADEYALDYLASTTGGQNLTASSQGDLATLFRDVFLLDRVHYRITYTPPSFVGDHTVLLRIGPTDSTIIERTALYGRSWDHDRLDESLPKVIALFPFATASPLLFDSTVFRRLADHLKGNPQTIARLLGHTDSEGTRSLNQRLSVQRATRIRDMLVRLGVPRRQLRVIGYGETRLLNRPDWPNRQAALENRRVEVELVSR